MYTWKCLNFASFLIEWMAWVPRPHAEGRGEASPQAGHAVWSWGWGLRAGFPLLGLNPSAGNIARLPGWWGCSLISEMKTGTPRRGSWSCLFLPGIKTLIRKRARKLEAPAGSAIPSRGEHERPASWGLELCYLAGDFPWCPTRCCKVCVVLAWFYS